MHDILQFQVMKHMWKLVTTWATVAHPYYNYPPCLLLSYYTVLPALIHTTMNRIYKPCIWLPLYIFLQEAKNNCCPRLYFRKISNWKKTEELTLPSFSSAVSLVSCYEQILSCYQVGCCRPRKEICRHRSLTLLCSSGFRLDEGKMGKGQRLQLHTITQTQHNYIQAVQKVKGL